MKRIQLINLTPQGDENGLLIAIEENLQIPFEIQRVFYIYNTKNNVTRGNHANRHSELFLIPLQGKVTVEADDGVHRNTFTLANPHQGLYLDKMTWKSMTDFAPGTVVLVLASHHYDPAEYIHDHAAFLAEVVKTESVKEETSS